MGRTCFLKGAYIPTNGWILVLRWANMSYCFYLYSPDMPSVYNIISGTLWFHGWGVVIREKKVGTHWAGWYGETSSCPCGASTLPKETGFQSRTSWPALPPERPATPHPPLMGHSSLLYSTRLLLSSCPLPLPVGGFYFLSHWGQPWPYDLTCFGQWNVSGWDMCQSWAETCGLAP